MYQRMERKSRKSNQMHQKKSISDMHGKTCIQRRAGDLECGAKVWYVDKKNENCETTYHTGRNDGSQGSINGVLGVFDRYYLGNMRNMTGQNPAGQCAEPHAVANCLQEIDISNFKRIRKIEVSDAVFTQECGQRITDSIRREREQEQAGRQEGSVMPERCSPLQKNSEYKTFLEYVLSNRKLGELKLEDVAVRVVGRTFPRCTTCQQWIDGNRVKLSAINSLIRKD